MAQPARTRTGMITGTVDAYDKRKGYGFIAPDGGGAQVFVSFREVIRAGLGPLSTGQRLRFRVTTATPLRMATDLAPLPA